MMGFLFRGRFFRSVQLGIVAGCALLGVAGYALAAEFSVKLTAAGPQPSVFTAALGDTVTFVNNDSSTHTVVDRQTGLQSPALAPGQSFPYVLTTSGRLTYQQEGSPRSAGQIVVQRTGTVTLKTSRRSIAFGSGAILSGTSSLPAFPVKIEMRGKTAPRWSDLSTVTPASDGSFTVPVRPTEGARYRANVLDGQLLSSLIQIDVRPVLKLTARARTAAAGSLLTLTVRILPADAATSVNLTRFDSQRQRWRSVVTQGVSKGKATFRWRVEFGRSLLRAAVVKHGLVPGFAEGSSRAVVVNGTGTPPVKHRRRH
jgi:plastocyanin